MKVRDLMTKDVTTLMIHEELSLADDIMTLGRIRHLPVVDKGKLVGIISQRDLFRASLASVMRYPAEARREFLKTVVVKEVMTQKVISISPEADVKEAGLIMLEKKVGCLPVVEDRELVGLITETDILGYCIAKL